MPLPPRVTRPASCARPMCRGFVQCGSARRARWCRAAKHGGFSQQPHVPRPRPRPTIVLDDFLQYYLRARAQGWVLVTQLVGVLVCISHRVRSTPRLTPRHIPCATSIRDLQSTHAEYPSHSHAVGGRAHTNSGERRGPMARATSHARQETTFRIR